MLQNWLKPQSAEILHHAQALPNDCLGAGLLQHDKTNFPSLKGVKIAILGLDELAADAIRKQLYAMELPAQEVAIADLGNLRKPNEASLLIPVLYELLSGKVMPILIGGSDDMARAQFLSYQNAKALVNMAVIDERFRFSAEKTEASVYGPILKPRHALLFHFALVGYQIHQTSSKGLQYLASQNFEALRLGRSRASIEEAEPSIRDADLLAFHLSALKGCDAPAAQDQSPSGYFSEEACQLCRYAGMSDKLTSFGIFGYQPAQDNSTVTTQSISQMIWYFMEGFFQRKNDFPVSKDGLTEYIVDFRSMHYQLTFWKSIKSGRWWMQVPVDVKRKQQRHMLIPCSYQDYQQACREELPERLMLAFKRFE